MKRNIFVIVSLILISTSVFAQGSKFKGWTIKAGANYSTIVNKAKIDIPCSYKFGFTGGLAFDWAFTDIMGFSAEVLFSRQGADFDLKNKKKGVTVRENSNYLNIPLLANVFLTEDLTFKTGVQLSYYLAGDDKISGSSIADEPQYDLIGAYKTLDVSIPVGLSYQFKFGMIIDARYHFGLSDIVKKTPNFPQFEAHNRYASLTVGFRF